jgi:hypothetical protein
MKVLLNPKNLSAQHRASLNSYSTTANNIAHRRTPTQQLQTTSRIAERQLYNCNQHRASPNTNSTTAINIAHRRTPTLQLQSTSRIAKHQFYNCNQHLASLNANTVVMAYTWFVPSLVP